MPLLLLLTVYLLLCCHSCDPNMVKQTVYCEVQDARLPRMAFFAAKPLKAGQELTWDYEYEEGRFDGRQVKCCCGAEKCRGRLL